MSNIQPKTISGLYNEFLKLVKKKANIQTLKCIQSTNSTQKKINE